MSTILAVTYDSAVAVSASDSVADPAGPFAGFYTGTGGDISVALEKTGATVVFASTAPGTIVTVPIARVNSTGTAATSILGLQALPFKRAASS